MDLLVEEVIRGLCLVVLSLFPTFVGLKIIKTISQPILSLYVFVFLVTLFRLPSIVLVILVATFLILLICDVLFLIKFETYYFFGLSKRPAAMECMCKSTAECEGDISEDRGFVTFRNTKLKDLKNKAGTLTRIISEIKLKKSLTDKVAYIIVSNALFAIFAYRFVSLFV